METLPAAQAGHAVASPITELAVPGAQEVHDDCDELDEYEPAAHNVQLDCPGSCWNEPAAQAEHTVAPGEAVNVPGSQATHEP